MRKQIIVRTLENDTGKEYSEIAILSVKRGNVILRTDRYRHVWQQDGTEKELFKVKDDETD